MSEPERKKQEEKESNFEIFGKLQQQLLLCHVHAESNTKMPEQLVIASGAGRGGAGETLAIDELFEFLEKNFDAYRSNIANLIAVLPFIHNHIRLYARREYEKYDIGMVLYNFYEDHKDTETDVMIVVQIIHQVLHSLTIYGNKDISVSRKVFTQLAKLLPTINDRKLVSNVVGCLQGYMKAYSGDNELLHIIWTDLSQGLQTDLVSRKALIDTLMLLFDELCEIHPNLYCDVKMMNTIQSLLKSNQREDRKCGYYLFKKMMHWFLMKSQNDNNIWFSSEYNQQIERSWTSYITILDNLEENQSHLIMPSLQNLNELIASKQLQSSWMNILYMRILTHKNKLVLRWSIEFFLDTFTCSDLHRDILKNLLEAVNSNVLYNCEGYFLNKEHFLSFLKGDLSNLYELLGDINWKPLPLLNLLTILDSRGLPKSVTYEHVLKIAARVRTLQDCQIRHEALVMVNKIFIEILDKLTMEEYVTYVETLYNPSDRYNVFEQFYTKKSTFANVKKENIFNGRFYEILLANIEYTTAEKLTTFLKDIPVSNHGCLKLLPFHCDFDYKTQQELSNLYGINVDHFSTYTIGKLISKFDLLLCCDLAERESKNETEQRRTSAIAFYVNNLESLDGENDETFKIIFNCKLTNKAIGKLCSCLKDTRRILDNWIIDSLIELVATVRTHCKECYYLCAYLEENNLCHIFVEKLLEKCPQFVIKCKANILEYLNKPDFFCDAIKKGEARIEECYLFNFIGSHTLDSSLQSICLRQIRVFSNEQFFLYLLNCHKAVTKKKPRYFANSYEHRIKMRIALGFVNALLVQNINDRISDELWDILLNENNQLNINYIYEHILATSDKRKDVILKKLEESHALTSSQQVSIISVIYTFCMMRNHHLDNDDKITIMTNLMALTMGANFHTRLFAQVALVNILNTEEFKDLSEASQILESITLATRGNISNHLNDFRFLMHNFKFSQYAWDVILYITNAPYDEVRKAIDLQFFPKEVQDQFNKCRLAFLKKMEQTAMENSENEVNFQLQRKMNPITDIIEPNNLMIYPAKETRNEMFVVATLVDKLPNLGGIARTCEVLGIQNLVMESKRDIEKHDFKNISMTAEKSLEIIEVKLNDLRDFLLTKQREGFAVVGAEQTSNSETFVNFKFPQKTVLLLGHEKDGIPPTLLGVLDHAVEIPQFGQVRSLNVHVTAALFMWEYCKQHLV